MELNINSPKYYKDVYGVDDEIYRLALFQLSLQKNYWKMENIKR